MASATTVTATGRRVAIAARDSNKLTGWGRPSAGGGTTPKIGC